MNALERQEFRLQILKVLCETLNYDMNSTLERNDQIFELFPNHSKDEVIQNIVYLGEKGYLKYSPIHYRGFSLPTLIKLLVPAIDLVEKIETKMPTTSYESDFSQNAITNFSNITHSQIIVNSPGASISITSSEENELINFLPD